MKTFFTVTSQTCTKMYFMSVKNEVDLDVSYENNHIPPYIDTNMKQANFYVNEIFVIIVTNTCIQATFPNYILD